MSTTALPAVATGLAAILDTRTAEGALVERLAGGKVRCVACGHRCVIFPGHRGICKVRFNDGGTLRVPWGYVAALQCDPTEKKPFFHVLPGSRTLTFGMLGCDYHCPGCQNWITSQALRDPASGVEPLDVAPDDLVHLARHHGARLVGSSYNEPLITAEWAVAVFQRARAAGLRPCFVSNGNATREALDYLRPWCDCYKVDLKAMRQDHYRQLGGVLDHVLETIRMVWAMGFWLEVVTLVIPGWNDADEDLAAAARFIASVSQDIPWHVTAFHPDYRMTDRGCTPPATLVRAARIGQATGLRYVYAGNLPGQVGRYEHTWCPSCGALLVERTGFLVGQNRLAATGGACPDCGTRIPGIWI
ncbi:MAG: AmmeMemoRadiSam system radical SAM enzyme [Armatimonadota bacterium]|nr:AmmeMemoRadiSam system radical SAM enzyme [Armatimonadota bacterium]MDR7485806.1 AmmeMemoRadiSam system radical SAM enzyme [Armatimonadota bacterium]MDR7532103.1 AmmeMemoRadiSam system radical SAM enzyme [Armatimonadota bacterium]MDR7536692.1 AmmeMemoRadiSam system radical SAM enzyme [Armatimonadota bacterium]